MLRLRSAAARLLVALAVLAAPACAIWRAPPRELRLRAEETTFEPEGGALRAEWTSDLAFVETTIDGHGPRSFLLDTGASVVVVSSALADEFGLDRVPVNQDSGGFSLPGALGTAVQVSEVVPLQELRFGPVTLRDVDALVVDAEFLGVVMGRRIDGVLPATAFRGALLTIDYPKRTVTVRPGSLAAPGTDGGAADVMPLVPGALPQVTLRVGEDLPAAGTRSTTDVALTSGPATSFPVLLDTGSNMFLAVPSNVAPEIRFRAPPVETGRQVTIGGVVPTHRGRIDGTVSWGRHSLADPVVSVDLGDRGSVGVAFLSEFRMTLDMANDRVRFERASAEPIRCLPVRGIGVGMIHRPDAWTIAYVLDDSSAARAGLVVGDRVETVEGLPATEFPRAVYDVIVASSTAVRMRVTGAGGTRDVVLPVVTLVE